MAKFIESLFVEQVVHLDGNEYESCVFDRCQMVFHGKAGVSMRGCQFRDCAVAFADEAARTMQFLASWYHGVQGGHKVVEQVFESIRKAAPAKTEGPQGSADAEKST